MGQKVVAIHQPNFFPWLGYFNKVAKADVFIIHDAVQFPKTGGTWMNRVRILVNGAPSWLTMPVRRNHHGHQMIHEVCINDQTAWREKCLATVKHSYRRTPYFDEVYPFLQRLFEHRADRLSDFNLNVIMALLEKLEIAPGCIQSGTRLNLRGQKKGTDLLVSMVEAVGGEAYLCGGGASGYQQDEKFGAAGLRLVKQEFRQAEYRQVGAKGFVPGLSIIDALMNCGFEGTRGLVMGTAMQPVPVS